LPALPSAKVAGLDDGWRTGGRVGMGRRERLLGGVVKHSEIKVGMRVFDLLPSLGYGEVVKVNKKTVWVLFYKYYNTEPVIYDIPHLQFLEKA
jgi:hypothetical protein